LQYHEGKVQYAASIKREKLMSWKEYCNVTTAVKPWNDVYKLAAGKRRHYSKFTSLPKPDGPLSTDMEETVTLMLEHFTPEDKVQDDSEFHKEIRSQTQGTVNTPDNRDFNFAEIRNAVESMNKNKTPVENGITGEIFKQAFETFPKYITA